MQLDARSGVPKPPRRRLGDRVGRLLGGLVAPVFALGSAVRQARVFHPVGVLHEGTVRALHPSAAGLEGRALLRFSGAIWRRDRAPDLLGLAIRFRNARPPAPRPEPRDQDLLLATFRALPELPLAVLRTDAHDFLGNVYTGGAAFSVPGLGDVHLEVVPVSPSPGAADLDRAARLDLAVSRGLARLELRARPRRGEPVTLAVIDVGPRLLLDERVLGFDPFRNGANLVPTGLVQSMRALVYPASRVGRGVTGRGGGSRGRA